MICTMNQRFVAICIVLTLCCFQPAKFDRWDGNVLYDLEGQGATFVTQANTWTVSTLKAAGTRVYTCDGVSILGGYGILTTGTGRYFEKTFSGLPAHNQISFYMAFYALDSWDYGENDHFTITLAGQTITGWRIPVFGGYAIDIDDICGSNYDDPGLIKTYMKVPHNTTSVTLKITSELNEASENESFGFRDISFTFELVDTPTSSFCGATSFELPNAWCSCPSTQYMSPAKSGSCLDCYTSCSSCTGGGINQCTSCKDGFYLSGTRCYACDDTCATCTGGASNQCKTCNTGDYLVGNNTCVSSCSGHFYNTTNGVVNFCESGCPGTFAYRNGICGNNCVSPNQTVTLATLKACYCYKSGATASDACYACHSSCASCDGTADNECRTCFAGFYLDRRPLLSIGTCKACNSPCVTCTGPALTQCTSCEDGYYLSGTRCYPCDDNCLTCTGGASNQCKTCHPGDYLVGNNTCVPICPKPFYSTSNPTIDFCETPCPGNFAFKNGGCNTTCPSPPMQTYTLAILKACVCYSAGATLSDPCYACDSSCATCNGTAANECFSCSNGSYLKNTTGLTIGTCEDCDPTCATCYGGAANQCNSCSPDAYLVRNGSAINGTCQDCDSSCLTCGGPLSTNCRSCPDRFYLALNSPLAVDGACLPCHPTCATCTGPARDECVTCVSPGECPSMFFEVSNSEASSGMIILGFIIGGTTSLMILAYIISKYKHARARAKVSKLPSENRADKILPIPLSPSTHPLRKSRLGDDRRPTRDPANITFG